VKAAEGQQTRGLVTEAPLVEDDLARARRAALAAQAAYRMDTVIARMAERPTSVTIVEEAPVAAAPAVLVDAARVAPAAAVTVPPERLGSWPMPGALQRL
jgi:hypothetical protein